MNELAEDLLAMDEDERAEFVLEIVQRENEVLSSALRNALDQMPDGAGMLACMDAQASAHSRGDADAARAVHSFARF